MATQCSGVTATKHGTRPCPKPPRHEVYEDEEFPAHPPIPQPTKILCQFHTVLWLTELPVGKIGHIRPHAPAERHALIHEIFPEAPCLDGTFH